MNEKIFLKILLKLKEKINKVLNSNDNNKMDIYEKNIYKLISNSTEYNKWFTSENIVLALKGIVYMLDEKKLKEWLNKINFSEKSKTIGIISAGNIPAAAFHDYLTVVCSGFKTIIKLSEKDNKLLPLIVSLLTKENNYFKEKTIFAKKIKPNQIDALIASGNDNTAKYLRYYFKDIPHLIRGHKNSIAILTGNETKEEIEKLGNDIFSYFGLGCRNVSKLFIPENYDFNFFFKNIYKFKYLANHTTYYTNYEYNRAIYLMSNFKILDNNFLILKEDKNLNSPVGTIFYEYYKNLDSLKEKIIKNKRKIQCIISKIKFKTIETIDFGMSQFPDIFDYPNEKNVIEFLSTF